LILILNAGDFVRFFNYPFDISKYFLVFVAIIIYGCNSKNSPGSISDPGPSQSIITNGTWESVSSSIPHLAITKSLKTDGSDIFAATQSFGIYRSSNNGDIWAATANGFPFDQNSSPGTELWGMDIVNNETIVNVSNSSQIYASTDYGKTWQIRNNGLIQSSISIMNKNEDKIYLTVGDSKAYYSNDVAASWHEINTSGITSQYIYEVFSINNKYYVLADSGISVSTDNGNNWLVINTELPPGIRLFPGLFSSKNIIIGYMAGALLSSDGGITWKVSKGWSQHNYPIGTIIESNNIVFAGGPDGTVYYSLDFGSTWHLLGNSINTNNPVTSLAVNGKYLLASTYGSGVFRYKLFY